MKLSEKRIKIVDALYSYSAFQLPTICSSIGLADGTEDEAFSSKRKYVEKRLYKYNNNTIDELIERIKGQLEIDIFPTRNYSYKLSNITKRDLVKYLMDELYNANDFFNGEEGFVWYGVMSEIEFIKKFHDLKKIKSIYSDKDFEYEYNRHVINNDDFSSDWFFEDERFLFKSGTDKQRLDILCYMFHPEVRNDYINWKIHLNTINSLLNGDGFELYEDGDISGRVKYGWRKIIGSNSIIINENSSAIKNILNSAYIHSQIELMNSNIEKNPYEAIGKAKDLLESVLISILDELGVEYNKDDSLLKVEKAVRKELNLINEKIKNNTLKKENERKVKINNAVVLIISGLGNITHGMSELRNLIGSGHGKSKSFEMVPSRYARLAVGMASTYSVFLLETYDYNKEKSNR